MPRIKRGLERPAKARYAGLLAELAGELSSSRESGQPLIDEFHLPRTNAVNVTVVWDKWERVHPEDRSQLIVDAYEQVEGEEYRDRIGLAIGYTVREAHESGLLPYGIVTALRKTDAVTPEQCAEAMIAQGASTLGDRGAPVLRFTSEEEAEACRRRLIDALPGSEPVWVIAKEVGRFEE